MQFNLTEIPPKTDLLSQFPQLALYDEFRAIVPGIDSMQVLRYVIYAFDNSSWNAELNKISDYAKRKEKAAEKAGLKLKDELVQDLLSGKLPEANAMITRFFRLQKKYPFERWVALSEYYHELTEQIRIPILKKDLSEDDLLKAFTTKSKLVADSKVIAEDLRELERELFGEDDALKSSIENGLAQSDFTEGKAEKYARLIKEKTTTKK
jgi:hypothetical protein